MSRVNPLHIVLLALTLLGLGGYRLHLALEHNGQMHASLSEVRRVGERTEALRRTWFATPSANPALQRLLNSAAVKNGGVTMTRQGDHLSLRAARMDARSLDALLDSVLNAPCEIRSIEIRRVDDTHASLLLEIAV